MVEHRTCNAGVASSNPADGTISKHIADVVCFFMEKCVSGGMVDTLVLEASGESRESSSLSLRTKQFGGVAHLGERLICIQEVAGSSPVTSTKYYVFSSNSSI